MRRLTIGSLFSGYGGLDIAAEHVLGARPVWFADTSVAASKVLAHRWRGVPNHGDLTAVDWTTVQPVDVLTGGFPCQDVSAGGKRAGLIRHGAHSTRSGLWAAMATAIDHLRPRLVIAENVRGLLHAQADSAVEPCPWCVDHINPKHRLRALGAVLADLADLGYDAAWHGLRASDLGACHERFRVFIAAWPATHTGRPGQEGTRPAEPGGRTVAAVGSAADTGGETGHLRPGPCPDPPAQLRRRRPDHSRAWPPAPHPASQRRTQGRPEPTQLRRQPDTAQRGHAAADTGSQRRHRRTDVHRARRNTPIGQQTVRDTGHRAVAWGDYEPAIRRWEHHLGRLAPPPTEPGRTGAPRLSPRFVEWMQGLDNGHVTAVPGLTRSDMLTLLGNGVIPLQAATAIPAILAMGRTTQEALS